MEDDSLYTAPASAVFVEGNAWNFGIDGRPYYAMWARPSGRRKSGRHLIKCGLAHPMRMTIPWAASDGPLAHDGILRKMREWSSLHADDGRLRCVAALDENPDEPDGEVPWRGGREIRQAGHRRARRARREARRAGRRRDIMPSHALHSTLHSALHSTLHPALHSTLHSTLHSALHHLASKKNHINALKMVVTFGLWIDFQQTTSGGFHHLSSFEVKHLVSCLAVNTTHNTRFLPNRVPSGWALDSEEMKFWWPKSLQKVIS